MPDITISLTNNQAQRLVASLGPIPEGMTAQEWVIANTKRFWKNKIKQAETRLAAEAAHQSAGAQVETDFAGF